MTVYVYSITSKISGRKYIGITQRPPKRRWQGHIRDALLVGTTTVIARALRKYGPECFEFKVIYEAVDRREANAVERGLIAAHGTLLPNGYNITIGGDFAPTRTGMIASDETKAKMSAASLGRKKSSEHTENSRRARTGLKHTPEHIENRMKRIRGMTMRKRTPRETLDGRIRRRQESIVRGACRIEKCNGDGPWRARISLDGKSVHLGLFESEDSARKAYHKAAHAHLDSLIAEREFLIGNAGATLQTTRHSAVMVERRDRMESMRKIWNDPQSKAKWARQISEGHHRRHQKTLPPMENGS